MPTLAEEGQSMSKSSLLEQHFDLNTYAFKPYKEFKMPPDWNSEVSVKFYLQRAGGRDFQCQLELRLVRHISLQACLQEAIDKGHLHYPGSYLVVRDNKAELFSVETIPQPRLRIKT